MQASSGKAASMFWFIWHYFVAHVIEAHIATYLHKSAHKRTFIN